MTLTCNGIIGVQKYQGGFFGKCVERCGREYASEDGGFFLTALV